MKEKISVSFIQFAIEADPFEAEVVENNYDKAINMIDEAAKTTKDLIVLPDEIAGGYTYGPMNIPMEFDNEHMERLKAKAKEYSIYIAGAVLAKQDYITSYSKGFLIDRNGEVVFEQNRNNVLAEEERFVIKNEDEIRVYETDFGKIVFLIGIDIMSPNLSIQLMEKEFDIIISPNMFYGQEGRGESYPAEFFKTCARARAMEHQAFVLMSNSIGTDYHTEEVIVGNSVVISPDGTSRISGNTEGVFHYEIDSDEKESKYLSIFKIKK